MIRGWLICLVLFSLGTWAHGVEDFTRIFVHYDWISPVKHGEKFCLSVDQRAPFKPSVLRLLHPILDSCQFVLEVETSHLPEVTQWLNSESGVRWETVTSLSKIAAKAEIAKPIDERKLKSIAESLHVVPFTARLQVLKNALPFFADTAAEQMDGLSLAVRNAIVNDLDRLSNQIEIIYSVLWFQKKKELQPGLSERFPDLVEADLKAHLREEIRKPENFRELEPFKNDLLAIKSLLEKLGTEDSQFLALHLLRLGDSASLPEILADEREKKKNFLYLLDLIDRMVTQTASLENPMVGCSPCSLLDIPGIRRTYVKPYLDNPRLSFGRWLTYKPLVFLAVTPSDFYRDRLIAFFLKEEGRLLLLDSWNHRKYTLAGEKELQENLINSQAIPDWIKENWLKEREEKDERTQSIRANYHVDELLRRLAEPFRSDFLQYDPDLFLLNGGKILETLYRKSKTEPFRLYVLHCGIIWLDSVVKFRGQAKVSSELGGLSDRLKEFFNAERARLQQEFEKRG